MSSSKGFIRPRVYLLILCLVSLLSPPTQSRHITSEENLGLICTNIRHEGWWLIGTVVTCYGKISITSTFSDSTVSSVVHTNGSKVANFEEITALNIYGPTLTNFIPSGIKSQFPNLKALQISDCGLFSVNKENLKEFGKALGHLDLSYNLLTSIDGDLFQYNPNMKVISLNDNPIFHIDSEFFTNLKSLKSVEV